MIKTEAGNPRGILSALGETDERVRYSRRLPAMELRFFIEHYWIIDWDLTGLPPERAETLPHPSIHLVFEKGHSRVVGVVRGKFTRILEGKGGVFGIKFRPGAFYPFVKTPVSNFTDRVIQVQDLFGPAAVAIESEIFSLQEEDDRVQLADRFLRAHLPDEDANVTLISDIVARVIAERRISKVDDLVAQFGIEKRSLQRIFSQYVGITPKWMIKRYRLHEAVEEIAKGVDVDWAALAVDLGYFDQAHFIKDFKMLVGCSPAEYQKRRTQSV